MGNETSEAAALTALVLKGALSASEANTLIDASLSAALLSHPELEQDFRQIAATMTAQTNLARLDLERKLKKT